MINNHTSSLVPTYAKLNKLLECLREVSLWCNGLSARLWNCSEQVQTPVALLRSLSDKYPRERYEPTYPPS